MQDIDGHNVRAKASEFRKLTVQGTDSQDETMFGQLFSEPEPRSPEQARAAAPDLQQSWAAVLVACTDEALPAVHKVLQTASMADLHSSPCLDALLHVLNLGLCNQPVASSNVAVHLNGLTEALLAGDGLGYAVKALLAPADASAPSYLLAAAYRLRRQACRLLLQHIQLGEGSLMTTTLSGAQSGTPSADRELGFLQAWSEGAPNKVSCSLRTCSGPFALAQ